MTDSSSTSQDSLKTNTSQVLPDTLGNSPSGSKNLPKDQREGLQTIVPTKEKLNLEEKELSENTITIQGASGDSLSSSSNQNDPEDYGGGKTYIPPHISDLV